MYWLALIFFALGVVTPEVVRHDVALFREDEIESVLVLLATGALFFVFLWTDRARRALQADVRARTQELHDMSKDLATAYAHIGEMNRKIDIVTQFAARASSDVMRADGYRALCDAVCESAQHITHYETCHVYIVDTQSRQLLGRSHGAPTPTRQQTMALARARTGAHVMCGADDVPLMTIHKTQPPIVVVITAQDAAKRVTEDEVLLQMIAIIALNVVAGDAWCAVRMPQE